MMLNTSRRPSFKCWSQPAAAALIGIVVLSFAACGSATGSASSTSTTEHIAQQGAESRTKPFLTISNQTSPSSVIVTTAVLPEGGGPGDGGWIIVGTDHSRKVGSVVGSAQVKEGANHNVTVHVNPALSGGTYLVGLYSGKKPTVGERPVILKTFSVPTS
jgi:hypothetical protein